MWASFIACILYFVVFVGVELWLAPHGVKGLSVARLAAYVVYGICMLTMAYIFMRSRGMPTSGQSK